MRRLVRIQGDTVGEILRQLETARRTIAQQLSDVTDGLARLRLQALQTQIATAMKAFRTAAETSASLGADRAHNAGVDMVRAPLAAGGLEFTPRIDPRALSALKVSLTHLIGDVSTSVINRVNTQLAQVVIGTQPASSAIGEVQRLLGSARGRAKTIVYTELGRIYSAANQASMSDAAERLPGLRKRWIKSGKRHPRPDHVAAHGQLQPINQPFVITGEKLMFPRDPNASAAQTINCGCLSIPVTDGSTWGASTVRLDPLVAGGAVSREPRSIAPAAVAPPTVVSDAGGLLATMASSQNPFRASRSPWKSFPPVAFHASERSVKQHAAYAAAKSGDLGAAAKLVEALVSNEAIDTLAAMSARGRPLLAPVYAEEADGKNVIPLALARYLAAALDWDVETALIQSNRVGRTGQDGYFRLAVQPLFAGPAQAGQRYVLVDDFLGQGATLANLRGHIESRGGIVVGATTLTGKPVSAMLALSPSTLAELRALHGKDLETWWRGIFGYGFESLTESEARYLIQRADADRIRTEILARLREVG